MMAQSRNILRMNDAGPKEHTEGESEEDQDCDEVDVATHLKALNGINDCQSELDVVTREMLEMETKFNERRRNEYTRRAAHIKKIPNFWANALLNHPNILKLLGEEDKRRLKLIKWIDIQKQSEGVRRLTIGHHDEHTLFKDFTTTWKSQDGFGWCWQENFVEVPNEDSILLSWCSGQIFKYINEDVWPSPMEYYSRSRIKIVSSDHVSPIRVCQDSDREARLECRSESGHGSLLPAAVATTLIPFEEATPSPASCTRKRTMPTYYTQKSKCLRRKSPARNEVSHVQQQGAATDKGGDIFPLKLWQGILEGMDDTRDILNVFTAFPDLKPLSRGNEFSWLIGQVLPLLLPKYSSDPDGNKYNRKTKFYAKDYRLVSRRWNSAVGTMYEPHPHRVPYKSADVATDQFSTDHHFIGSDYPDMYTNFNTLMESGFARADDQVGGSNPFPGRRVYINSHWFDYSSKHNKLTEAVPYFQKLGHHIWYLEVNTDFREQAAVLDVISEWLQPLFQCLSFLPNLKSLKLRGAFDITDGNTDDESLWNLHPLPVMPFKLEILDMRDLDFRECPDFYSCLLSTLITHDNVAALRVSTEHKWNPQTFPTIFSHLTELKMYVDKLCDLEKTLSEMMRPSVRKLSLDISDNTVNILRLFQTLQPYNIDCLHLEFRYWYEMNHPWNEQVTLPTVKEFRIVVTKDNIDLRFLKGLPSLEYLTIYLPEVSNFGRGDFDILEVKAANGTKFHKFSVAARQYFNASGWYDEVEKVWKNFQSFWALAPNLKIFTFGPRQYVREVCNNGFKTPFYK